jgi:hypothetical protein
MKITESMLRKIIQEELAKSLVESPDASAAPAKNSKIKSTAASKALGAKLQGSTAIQSAADRTSLSTPESVAATISSLIQPIASDSQLKPQVLIAALKKVMSDVVQSAQAEKK